MNLNITVVLRPNQVKQLNKIIESQKRNNFNLVRIKTITVRQKSATNVVHIWYEIIEIDFG